MKIDRRKFLACLGALAGGGTVGTMLSPLPWKVMDDIAIWTQNWPWTPVPKGGQSYYVQSVCSLCSGGCGISVRKVSNRAVKIEGLTDHPINKGGLCPLGLSGLQYLYGPSRVKSPLKRTGNRGEGKWQPVSWDEALLEVTKQLVTLRSQGKPNTVAWISGSEKGTVSSLIDRFLKVYGSSNHLRAATAQDALEQAAYLMQGNQGAVMPDVENADYILSFGAGLLDGWGAPCRMFNLYGDSINSKTIIQFEPRLSDTGAKSSQWVPINPGTEGALALGMAHIIVRELLYNIDFINNNAFGFDDWTDDSGEIRQGFKAMILDKFQPDKVSQITGIPVGRIFEISRGFAKAKKPLALCGRGQGQVPGSIDETLAIYCLNALMGNINQSGGTGATSEPDYIQWPEVSVDGIASQDVQQGKIDGAGSEKFPFSHNLLHRLPEIINSAAGEKPVQALLVSDANPLYTLPDAKAVKKAFDNIPFIVSFSSYMDETAVYADYILPDHTYLERYQDIPTSTMASTVIGLSKPVIKPLYDTRHIGDVIIALAKGMGESAQSAFPWKNYESLLEETFGANWDELKKKGYMTIERQAPETASYTFSTPSGKLEFYPTARKGTEGKEIASLPFFTAVPIEGDMQQFPLVMIPYDSIRIANHNIANSPFMTKIVDDTVLKKTYAFIEINPLTAKSLRLSEGDEARLSTPKGQAAVKVHLYEGIMPGVIALPKGLGHTAYSEEWGLAGKGVNANDLIGPINDPASGLDMAWGIRAKLSRV